LDTQLPISYAHLAIADEQFRAALRHCGEYDKAIAELVLAGTEFHPELIGPAVGKFREAVVDLHATAEAYHLAFE
jgi:hypothetical protein